MSNHKTILVLVLISLFMSPSLTQAHPGTDTEGFTPFTVTQDSFTITWEKIVAGEPIFYVFNNRTNDDIDLLLELEEFNFKDQDGLDKSNAEVLVVKTDPTLPVAGQVAITFKPISEEITLKPGDYKAYVHISDGDSVLHVQVTIQVESKQVSPEPLVSKWTIKAMRWLPFPSSFFWIQNDHLPLKITETTRPDIALEKEIPLGYLTSPVAGLSSVTWAGESQFQETENWAIQLVLNNLKHTGDYSGAIDLLPKDDDKGSVELTVKSTDFVIWPILAIVLGVAAGYWIKKRQNVFGPINSLKHFEKHDMVNEGKVAPIVLPNTQNIYRLHGYQQAYQAIQDEIQGLEKNYQSKVVMLNEEIKAYKDIVEHKASLRKNLDLWKGYETDIAKLYNEYNNMDQYVSDNKFDLCQCEYLIDFQDPPGHPSEIKPPLLVTAASLLETKNLNLQKGDESYIEVHRGKVVQATELLKNWVSWAKRLSITKDQFETASKPPSLWEIIQKTSFELSKIETLLCETGDFAKLEKMDIEALITNVEAWVAGIKCYQDPSPESWQSDFEVQQIKGVEPQEEDKSLLSRVITGLSTLVSPTPVTQPSDPGKHQAAIKKIILVNNTLLFIIALAISIAAALGSLYIGQTFGAPIDYIKAFGWGLGVKAGVEAIYEGVNRFI